jgi:hypothetical protein
MVSDVGPYHMRLLSQPLMGSALPFGESPDQNTPSTLQVHRHLAPTP